MFGVHRGRFRAGHSSKPPRVCRRSKPSDWEPMSKKHTYVLGINAYDHDTSACLLRDGEIALAIAKERINRQKHAMGFYRIAVDYCLEAEGITLDDVDLIVRNCYVMPVEEMDRRLVNHDWPAYLSAEEREQTAHD